MTKAPKKPATRFERMRKSLPMCVLVDPLVDTTEADLEFLVQHEIDITEEGQDGTSRRNLKPLLNWLLKWNLEGWS